MTATTAEPATGEVTIAPRSVDQVTRTPEAPLASTPRRALDYELLTPPNYENIVGGAAPSPIASILLVGGALLILAAIVQNAMGATDTTEWWGSGAVLAAVALFLAAFVSRR